MRRFVLFIALLIGIGASYFFWSRGGYSANRPAPGAAVPPDSVMRSAGGRPGGSAPNSGRPASSSATVAEGSAPAASLTEADFPIAAPLNAPGSTVARDLDIVSQLFEAWQSNFPGQGNPVGENAEITAALMGENPLGFALIPKGHRAVNEQGELCDRWGTPLRLHQLSGTRMEIQSAGPDRKFATTDDAIWTPQ